MVGYLLRLISVLRKFPPHHNLGSRVGRCNTGDREAGQLPREELAGALGRVAVQGAEKRGI